jgi:hypothetical protein
MIEIKLNQVKKRIPKLALSDAKHFANPHPVPPHITPLQTARSVNLTVCTIGPIGFLITPMLKFSF